MMLAQDTPFVPPTCPSGLRWRPPGWDTAIGALMDDPPTVVVHMHDDLLRPAIARILHTRGFKVLETRSEWELEFAFACSDVLVVVVRDVDDLVLASTMSPGSSAVCWWQADEIDLGSALRGMSFD